MTFFLFPKPSNSVGLFLLTLSLLSCSSTSKESSVSSPTASDPPVTEQIKVHLTIDDLPWMVERNHQVKESITAIKQKNKALVKILSEHQVKASVFFTCSRIRHGDESIKTWEEGGHSIGNHTWAHARLANVGAEAWIKEAKDCHDYLTQNLEKPSRWLRYPHLCYGQNKEERDIVTAALAEFGEQTAPVTVATTEWLFAYTYRKALRLGDENLKQLVITGWHQHMDESLQAGIDAAKIVPGRAIPQTVLVHMNELVIDEIGTLITRWKQRGIQFIDLETTMADPVFQQENHYTGPAGISWLWRIRTKNQYGKYWFGVEQGRISKQFGDIDPLDKGIPLTGQ